MLHRISRMFYLAHTEDASPGLWNLYFGHAPYDIINSGKIIAQHEDENLYITNCQFINLINRAITIINMGYSKILNSFCFFQDCSTQNPNRGGSFYSQYSDVIFYYCCVVNSTSEGNEMFSYIEGSTSDFETCFETCTISSCGNDINNRDSTIQLRNINKLISSTNFSNNVVGVNTCVNSYNYKVDALSKFKFCFIIRNNGTKYTVLTSGGAFSFSYCNVLQNKLQYFGVVNIHKCESQIIYYSCFDQNNSPYDISFYQTGSIYIVKCSFTRAASISYDYGINKDEIGNKQFSINLEHLVLAECDAPVQKTMEVLNNNANNAFIKMKCSCQNVQRLFGLQSNIMPSIFFEYSILQ